MRTRPMIRSTLTRTIDALVGLHLTNLASVSRIINVGEAVRMTTGLIHEIQRERGLASGHLSSEGTRFTREWVAQTNRSQDAWKKTLVAWEKVPRDPRDDAIESALARGTREDADLAALRDDVRSRRITSGASADRYSKVVEAFLALVAQASGTSGHPEVSRALLSLYHFVTAKEATGQQRALGVSICSQEAFEPFQWERYQRLHQLLVESLAAARDQGTGRPTKVLDHYEESRTWKAFDALRTPLLEGPEGAMNLPSAEEWFRRSTAVIDDFHRIELRLLDDIGHLCRTVRETELPTSEPPEAAELWAEARSDLERAAQLAVRLQALNVRARVLSLDAKMASTDRLGWAREAEELSNELAKVTQGANQLEETLRRSSTRLEAYIQQNRLSKKEPHV